jgi:hypothetical protein
MSSMGHSRWVRPTVKAVAAVTAARQGQHGGDRRERPVWRENGASSRCGEPMAQDRRGCGDGQAHA